MAGYEYASISSAATLTAFHGLIAMVNNLATDGWEVVSSHSVDKTVGLNNLAVVIRREIEPLPPPPATDAGWYPDPSGRWDGRYWSGRAWTWGVARSGEDKTHRDPPTMLEPAEGLSQ